MSATSERLQTLSLGVSLYCAASSETIAAWTQKKKSGVSACSSWWQTRCLQSHPHHHRCWRRRQFEPSRLTQTSSSCKNSRCELKKTPFPGSPALGVRGRWGRAPPGWHTSVRCHMDVWHHSPLILKGIICSALLYPPTPPFCLPSGISGSESMCCGLALDEQSYYEKSNPSLGDRGVTGFKKTPSDLIPTFLGSQTACSECWNGTDTSHAWRQLRSSSQANASVFRRREESKLPGGRRTGGRKSSSCPREYDLFFFTASTVYNSLHVNFDLSILEFYSRK